MFYICVLDQEWCINVLFCSLWMLKQKQNAHFNYVTDSECLPTKWKWRRCASPTWVWAPGARCCTWTPSSPPWCSWCSRPCPCQSRRRCRAEQSGFSDPAELHTAVGGKELWGGGGGTEKQSGRNAPLPTSSFFKLNMAEIFLTTDGAQLTLIKITKSSVGTFYI